MGVESTERSRRTKAAKRRIVSGVAGLRSIAMSEQAQRAREARQDKEANSTRWERTATCAVEEDAAERIMGMETSDVMSRGRVADTDGWRTSQKQDLSGSAGDAGMDMYSTGQKGAREGWS